MKERLRQRAIDASEAAAYAEDEQRAIERATPEPLRRRAHLLAFMTAVHSVWPPLGLRRSR